MFVGQFSEENARGLAQSKGLASHASPTVRRPFKGLSGKRARFEASVSCRIAPNSAIFRQKRADNGRKWGPLSADFGRASRLVSRPLWRERPAPARRVVQAVTASRRKLKIPDRPPRAGGPRHSGRDARATFLTFMSHTRCGPNTPITAAGRISA